MNIRFYIAMARLFIVRLVSVYLQFPVMLEIVTYILCLGCIYRLFVSVRICGTPSVECNSIGCAERMKLLCVFVLSALVTNNKKM